MFHTLETALRKPEVDDVSPDVHGEMWMVHGGGFFRMQKTRALPGRFTGDLHWFKYEAYFTWISGFLLLIALYYLTGGVFAFVQTLEAAGAWPPQRSGVQACASAGHAESRATIPITV